MASAETAQEVQVWSGDTYDGISGTIVSRTAAQMACGNIILCSVSVSVRIFQFSRIRFFIGILVLVFHLHDSILLFLVVIV